MTLAEFNALPSTNAELVLLDCCGCKRWAAEMSAKRPFTGLKALLDAADDQWRTFTRSEWLEAFSHHPRIGEKPTTGSESHRRWSEGEQSGARVATEDVQARLASGNRSYYDKFGYICMICAAGKSADEMLALLEQRLENDPEQELPVAAEQQRQISRLRLNKLLAGETKP